MSFSSISFLFFFLPFVLTAYACLPWRNAVLLIVSLFFYAWGEGVYVVVLVAVIAMNYVVGERISSRSSKLWLWIGVSANLVVLVYFKYLSFLLNDVLLVSHPIETKLPLGISFFIFQSISYLVDVKRNHAEKAENLVDLGLYISLFPQLIAGPIVRYNSIANAIKARSINAADARIGMELFLLGLAQKVLIADTLAKPVDEIFALTPDTLSTPIAWLGISYYSLQIFYDFAGYSLMAIGLGRIFGFTFPQNFNFPYASGSVTEFWRRWHMSLSSWFKDYLYIPLGGNRKGSSRTTFNLFCVFILCGLWHGAAWTFLIWGLLHGALLTLERLSLSRYLTRCPSLLSNLYMWMAISISWVIFRADNMTHASQYLMTMFSDTDSPLPVAYYLSNELTVVFIVGLLFCYQTLPNRLRALQQHTNPVIVTIKYALFALLITLTFAKVLAGSYSPFIYFRF